MDKLRPTATGLDLIPAWFLRLVAPVFAAPISQLFNQSIIQAVVPVQWKKAFICPIPKVTHPESPVDFRPISITPVLSRIMEKLVVRNYIYPALLTPPQTLTFQDQFAFRPTGSTTAALIAFYHHICEMLSTNPYVRVIALDFSKAFDTVRYLRSWPDWTFPTKFIIGYGTSSKHGLKALNFQETNLTLPNC